MPTERLCLTDASPLCFSALAPRRTASASEPPRRPDRPASLPEGSGGLAAAGEEG